MSCVVIPKCLGGAGPGDMHFSVFPQPKLSYPLVNFSQQVYRPWGPQVAHEWAPGTILRAFCIGQTDSGFMLRRSSGGNNWPRNTRKELGLALSISSLQLWSALASRGRPVSRDFEISFTTGGTWNFGCSCLATLSSSQAGSDTTG